MEEIDILLLSLKFAGNFIYDKLNSKYCFSNAQKKELFNSHIEPSYQKLLEIHIDYTNKFNFAANSLINGENLKQVTQILKLERPIYLSKRQETIENLQALKHYRLNEKKQSEFELVFYRYVDSVVIYLNSSNSYTDISWYTYFINIFSEVVDRGENPLEYEYAIAGGSEHVISIVIELLEKTVQYDLPNSLREVQKQYGVLRAQCLQ